MTPLPSGWNLSQSQCSFNEHLLLPSEWRNRKFCNILEFHAICLFGETIYSLPSLLSKTERENNKNLHLKSTFIFPPTTKVISIME